MMMDGGFWIEKIKNHRGVNVGCWIEKDNKPQMYKCWMIDAGCWILD